MVETEQFLDCNIKFKKQENSRWNLSFYIFLVFLVPPHVTVGTAGQRCGPGGLRQPLILIGGTARVASGLQGPRRGAAALASEARTVAGPQGGRGGGEAAGWRRCRIPPAQNGWWGEGSGAADPPKGSRWALRPQPSP